jgi:hypothetical protein
MGGGWSNLRRDEQADRWGWFIRKIFRGKSRKHLLTLSSSQFDLKRPLFDHFVGAEQDGLRDRKAECLCGA